MIHIFPSTLRWIHCRILPWKHRILWLQNPQSMSRCDILFSCRYRTPIVSEIYSARRRPQSWWPERQKTTNPEFRTDRVQTVELPHWLLLFQRHRASKSRFSDESDLTIADCHCRRRSSQKPLETSEVSPNITLPPGAQIPTDGDSLRPSVGDYCRRHMAARIHGRRFLALCVMGRKLSGAVP